MPQARESIFSPSGSCRTADPHSGHLVPLCPYPSLLFIMPLLSSPINQVKTSTCHLLTHFLLAVQRGDSERESEREIRDRRSTGFGTCPILGLPYSIYVSVYLCVCVCSLVCLSFWSIYRDDAN